jgi:hypothetical protein
VVAVVVPVRLGLLRQVAVEELVVTVLLRQSPVLRSLALLVEVVLDILLRSVLSVALAVVVRVATIQRLLEPLERLTLAPVAVAVAIMVTVGPVALESLSLNILLRLP